MFERFTDRARQVLVLAQEEARLLDHHFIGTEHILLGLLDEREGVAARALVSFGFTEEAVREGVREAKGPGGSSITGSPPFTPRAKAVLELSLREALQLHDQHIGTEHLLLGLIREGEGAGVQVLVGLGGDLARIRQRVLDLLSKGEADEPPGAARAGSAPAHRAVRGPHAGERTRAVARVQSGAQILAGRLPVGTHHLLLAILDQPESVAAKVLISLNVNRQAVERRISEIDVAGTGDDLPG
jgi:ATP-dependent Clp protease ATP-binding subunit ClpC